MDKKDTMLIEFSLPEVTLHAIVTGDYILLDLCYFMMNILKQGNTGIIKDLVISN